MNTRSLKLIREVMINSGKVTSVEISQDSIYLEFKDVELGNPKSNEEMSLTVRFAEDSFFTVFYNNIWDVDFMSKYDYKKQLLSQEICEKSISSVEDFSIHNIRNDFFMLVDTKDVGFAVGGNQMDFFTPFERLDDASLRELSNEWMLYFLNYHLKRNIIKDPMCENHPLIYTKK